MALLQLQGSVNYRDLNGATAPQQVFFEMDDAKTLGALVTAIQAYQLLADPVTDAVIYGSDVKLVIPLSVGLKGSAGPNPIIQGANFTYTLTGFPNRSYGQHIPAWAQAKIVDGKIDLTDSAVQAYYKNWFPNNITNLSSFESNHWEGLQRAYRCKLADRSIEREVNRIGGEEIP